MSEGEAGIGRENEARLKEVLEMRKHLLGVSLDLRGDGELGSRNFLSVKVQMTQCCGSKHVPPFL